MAPEAGSEFHGFISKWGKFLNKLFKCNDSIFFKTVHKYPGFEVDVAVGFDDEVVLVHYLLWNKGGMNADVLEVCHGCTKVKISDVEAHVSGAFLCV